MYYLQGTDVFEALSGLAGRGVKLRIVQNPPSDEFPNTDSLYLADKNLAQVQGINMTRLVGGGIMHTKLWIVDEKHFYVGSANMDWRALTQVSNLAIYKISRVWPGQGRSLISPALSFIVFADSGERDRTAGRGL